MRIDKESALRKAATLFICICLSIIINMDANNAYKKDIELEMYLNTSNSAELGTVEVTNQTTGTILVHISSTDKFQEVTVYPSRKSVIPLTLGNGAYKIEIRKSTPTAETVVEKWLDFSPKDKYIMYKTPNLYVNWDNTPGTEFSALYSRLSNASTGVTEFINKSFEYVEVLQYDTDLAKSVIGHELTEYTASTENTILTQKGVCLDKAGLLAALLREKGIPTKLVWGYYNAEFHAWAEYMVNGEWLLLDPTKGIKQRSGKYRATEYF